MTHTYALVEWIDSAWFDVGSYFKADDPRIEPMHFESVGILIKDDDTGVALATDYTPDRSGEDRYRDVMFVPRVAVVKVTRLWSDLTVDEMRLLRRNIGSYHDDPDRVAIDGVREKLSAMLGL